MSWDFWIHFRIKELELAQVRLSVNDETFGLLFKQEGRAETGEKTERGGERERRRRRFEVWKELEDAREG